MKNESPLSLKQERFCQEYVTTGNATQAYRAAGYKVSSDEAAAAHASRFFNGDEAGGEDFRSGSNLQGLGVLRTRKGRHPG